MLLGMPCAASTVAALVLFVMAGRNVACIWSSALPAVLFGGVAVVFRLYVINMLAVRSFPTASGRSSRDTHL